MSNNYNDRYVLVKSWAGAQDNDCRENTFIIPNSSALMLTKAGKITHPETGANVYFDNVAEVFSALVVHKGWGKLPFDIISSELFLHFNDMSVPHKKSLKELEIRMVNLGQDLHNPLSEGQKSIPFTPDLRFLLE